MTDVITTLCGRHLQSQVIESLDRLDYRLSSDRLSLDSEDGFGTGCRNVSQTTVLLRTLITQMIFFNQGMLLLGSNHFLLTLSG